MKIYLIYNTKEERPMIERSNYGGIVSFTSIENAKAFLLDFKSNYSKVNKSLKDYVIKEIEYYVN
jgi:hypothetical protein